MPYRLGGHAEAAPENRNPGPPRAHRLSRRDAHGLFICPNYPTWTRVRFDPLGLCLQRAPGHYGHELVSCESCE